MLETKRTTVVMMMLMKNNIIVDLGFKNPIFFFIIVHYGTIQF